MNLGWCAAYRRSCIWELIAAYSFHIVGNEALLLIQNNSCHQNRALIPISHGIPYFEKYFQSTRKHEMRSEQ
jgi:hypothetical protein